MKGLSFFNCSLKVKVVHQKIFLSHKILYTGLVKSGYSCDETIRKHKNLQPAGSRFVDEENYWSPVFLVPSLFFNGKCLFVKFR